MKRENQTGKEEHMNKNYPQMATDLTRAIGTMRKGIPETMEAFPSLVQNGCYWR